MAIGSSPPGYISNGTQWDIQLLQNNDDTITFNMANGPVPLVLTPYTLTMYLKATAESSDLTAYSNTPTINSALLGQFTLSFPRAQLVAPTLGSSPLYYHVDALQSSAPQLTTLVFGNVYVLAV